MISKEALAVTNPEVATELASLWEQRIQLATEMNNYQTYSGEKALEAIDDEIAVLEGRQPIDRTKRAVPEDWEPIVEDWHRGY